MTLPPTSWTAICILGGIVALVYHGLLTFFLALGAGLASTEASRVPASADRFWAISLYGTVVPALFLIVMMIHYRMIWWRLYATAWLVVLACLWAGSWINAGGFPSYVGRWLLIDVVLAAITVGTGWYALLHYPREYFEKLEADME